MAETIKDTVGFKGELYFNTDKPDGTLKKLTDVSKLHALGWKHSVELTAGIEKCIVGTVIPSRSNSILL